MSIAAAGAGSTALPISCRVMRLVKPEIAAPWKAYRREQAPSLVTERAARDPFLGETGHLRPQVVAHEIKLVLSVGLSGMTGELSGRRCKDQPSTPGIDSGKAKDVFEKRPVGLGV